MMILVLGALSPAETVPTAASTHLQVGGGKAKCKTKYVTKKVHGKKKRVKVRVCTTAKPKPTSTPTATATDTPTETATATPTGSSTTGFSVGLDASWGSSANGTFGYYCLKVSTSPSQPGASVEAGLTAPDGFVNSQSSQTARLGPDGTRFYLVSLSSIHPLTGTFHWHVQVTNNGLTEVADRDVSVTSGNGPWQCGGP